MLNKLIKKIKKINEQNYFLNGPSEEEPNFIGLNQETAELEMIDTITNFKVILAHLKDQEDQQIKFVKLIRMIAVEQINLPELKHQFYNYISYQYYTLRSLVWKILVEYLPTRNNKWITKIQANKVGYQQLINDNLISSIKRKDKEGEARQKVEPAGKVIVNAKVDHPLNRSLNSTWNTYFKDHELWTKIEKDMLRTRTKINFFQEQHQLELETIDFEQPLNLSKNKRRCCHHDAVSRILFLYAKLHPETGYSQGMNEIAALIYFSFTSKNTEYQRRVSQSDSYFVFCTIMQKVGPLQFTNQDFINNRVKTFCEALKKVDQKLYKILDENNIDLKLVCMRWIMVYMLQEYQINEAILIWDGLLCSQVGINKYIYYLCLAVMVIRREQIVENPASIYGQLKVKPRELLETSMHLYKEYPSLVN